jgi:hypothetical protein
MPPTLRKPVIDITHVQKAFTDKPSCGAIPALSSRILAMTKPKSMVTAPGGNCTPNCFDVFT